MAPCSVRVNRAAGSNAGDAGESAGQSRAVFLEQDCTTHSRGLWKSRRALPEKILRVVQTACGADPLVRGRRPRRPFATGQPDQRVRRGRARPPHFYSSTTVTHDARALYFSPQAPYPAIGGGPLRSASLLEYLSRRFSVHAIIFREPGAPDPALAMPSGRVGKLDVVTLQYHSKQPFARALRNLSRIVRHRPPLLDRFSGF